MASVIFKSVKPSLTLSRNFLKLAPNLSKWCTYLQDAKKNMSVYLGFSFYRKFVFLFLLSEYFGTCLERSLDKSRWWCMSNLLLCFLKQSKTINTCSKLMSKCALVYLTVYFYELGIWKDLGFLYLFFLLYVLFSVFNNLNRATSHPRL